MFVSFAQNFEDVLLWRALKTVERGTYVDVGANHPSIGSVTYAFYERGWRGINIEPVPADHQLLEAERPGDVNLRVAAGERVETRTLYQFGVRGLATLSQTTVERHRQAGLKVEETEVPVEPLSAICEKHVRGEIHFLKIDVEGFEVYVLKGMDFKRWRPWVMVIEATLPNSSELAHQEWEDLVLRENYVCTHFDGLSRYYVSKEREPTLRPLLSVQPNVFDDFVSSRVVGLESENAKLQGQVAKLTAQLTSLREAGSVAVQNLALEEELEALKGELAAARSAWNASELTAQAARAQAAALEQQVRILKNDPYYRSGEAVRSFVQRLQKRT
jgi:FkbM family methyltransferase